MLPTKATHASTLSLYLFQSKKNNESTLDFKLTNIIIIDLEQNGEVVICNSTLLMKIAIASK